MGNGPIPVAGREQKEEGPSCREPHGHNGIALVAFLKRGDGQDRNIGVGRFSIYG